MSWRIRVDNLFGAILGDLEHSDRFVRSQRYVLRRRSRGMQRSGFEIGFWVVATDPEFWHLDAPLDVSDELPGRRRGLRCACSAGSCSTVRVFRFRRWYHFAAPAFTNVENKGTLAIDDSSVPIWASEDHRHC